MATPVLSKKQQKSTLSAKKSRVKETIKNVLATPYNSFWPVVPSEDNEMLEKILKTNLPRIKEVKVSVPWRDLKNIPKTDRKKFREDYSRKMNTEKVNKSESENFYLGINHVSKLLEGNLASVVLITSDLEPRFMVQHIIDLCVLYRVPVLIVNHLRTLLEHHCGISSTSLSISKNVSSEAKLFLIKQATQQIFQRISVPINHKNYNRFSNKFDIILEGYVDDKMTKKEELVDEQVIKDVVYLKRTTKNRTFIPQIDKVNKMDVDRIDFIAFSQITNKSEKVESSGYKSLVVKRLKGDHRRKKRKAKLLKVTKT